MMKYILAILFSAVVFNSFSQQTTKYKIRVRYEDYSPLPNIPFIINGGRIATDNQGIIDINVKEGQSYISIQSADNKAYEIKFPLEGRAILPKDLQVFIDIYVSPIKKTITASKEDLKSAAKQIINAQSGSEARLLKTLEEQSKKINENIAALLKNDKIDNAKLAEGRLQFFPLISEALNHYLNEVRDFNDATASIAFNLNSKSNYDQFIASTYNYNEIFELLNQNKSSYEQAISTYWNSKELSLKFSNLMEFTIEEIHKPYVLDINYSLIDKLYAYKKETNKKKKKELESLLLKDIEIRNAALNRRLGILGERITAFISLLNNNKTIDN